MGTNSLKLAKRGMLWSTTHVERACGMIGRPVITMATDLAKEIEAKCQPVRPNLEIKCHRRRYSWKTNKQVNKYTRKLENWRKQNAFSYVERNDDNKSNQTFLAARRSNSCPISIQTHYLFQTFKLKSFVTWKWDRRSMFRLVAVYFDIIVYLKTEARCWKQDRQIKMNVGLNGTTGLFFLKADKKHSRNRRNLSTFGTSRKTKWVLWVIQCFLASSGLMQLICLIVPKSLTGKDDAFVQHSGKLGRCRIGYTSVCFCEELRSSLFFKCPTE